MSRERGHFVGKQTRRPGGRHTVLVALFLKEAIQDRGYDTAQSATGGEKMNAHRKQKLATGTIVLLLINRTQQRRLTDYPLAHCLTPLSAPDATIRR